MLSVFCVKPGRILHYVFDQIHVFHYYDGYSRGIKFFYKKIIKT